MNYMSLYHKLTSVNTNLQFFETHHIIPKCMGGDDSDANLVNLTYRQHYITHKLLTKIYPNNKKIATAFKLMVFKNRGKYYNSRDFEKAREEHIKSMIENNPMYNASSKEKMRQTMINKYQDGWTPRVGKTHSDETRNLISENRKGKMCGENHPHFGKTFSEKTKRLISESRNKNAHLYDKPRTEEVKKKISDSLAGRVRTNDHSRAISEAKKNCPPIICPHCNKSLRPSPGAYRWHFDNCKLALKD